MEVKKEEGKMFDKIIRVRHTFGLFIGKMKSYDILGITLTEAAIVNFIPEKKLFILTKVTTDIILSGNLLIEEVLEEDEMMVSYIKVMTGIIIPNNLMKLRN